MNDLQLRCFLAVANGLSFARAAKHLNVSQPTITHQIKLLEEELGTKLFYRSTRIVELTSEGRSFITDAEHILAIANQAKIRFSNPEDRPYEVLTIGCSNYVLLNALSTVLTILREQHPNLHPRFSILPHDQLQTMIENDRIDIMFDSYNDDEVKEGIKYSELCTSRIMCIRRDENPAEKRDRIGLEEVRKQKLILYNPTFSVPDISNLRLADGLHRSDLHFCSSPEEACLLAKTGYGAAILPEIYITDLANMELLEIDDIPRISYGLFYKQRNVDTVQKSFTRIAKTCFE